MAAEAWPRGEMHRLLRPHRGRRRLRSGLDGDARREVAGGYRLNGAKMWITNAPVADVALVWAKLDGIIRGFLVERGTKGFSTPKIEGKLSLRASVTGEIVLDDVFVPEETLLPDVSGLRGPFACLNKARYGIAWGAMGAAEFCWHARATTCSTASSSAGRWPPASWCRRSSPTCRPRSRSACTGRCGSARHDRRRHGVAAGDQLMKRNNCGKALDIAREARDMHGGNGISGEYHVMRHAANLETVNTYEGAHDVHALILGRAQTGIQAFM